MIDLMPNQTVLYQWLIFMAVFVLLHWGIFRPVMRILEVRRERMEGERKRAEKYHLEAEGFVQICEKRLQEAKTVGMHEKETRRQEGEKRQGEILKMARAEIDQTMNQLRGEIEQASREAVLKLKQYSQELGREIASKVLEREV